MLDARTTAEVRDAVRPLAERFRLAERLEPYAAHRWSGSRARRPLLHLEDVSGIPFVSVVPGVEEYQHRARVRAGDGELFCAVTPPAPVPDAAPAPAPISPRHPNRRLR